MTRRRLQTFSFVVLLAAIGATVYWQRETIFKKAKPEIPGITPEIEAKIDSFCSACHAMPKADTFPKSYWKRIVERMFQMYLERSHSNGNSIDVKTVPQPTLTTRYFETLAPDTLPKIDEKTDSNSWKERFRFEKIRLKNLRMATSVTNVRFFPPKSGDTPDMLVCDFATGVSRLNVAKEFEQTVLAKVQFPCHTNICDLNQDGIDDILVAELGHYYPTDKRVGEAIWLRGLPNGQYKPVTLLKNVGRISDVRAADFDGDGKLDVLVASFGWFTSGGIYLLENVSSDPKEPQFEPRIIDTRSGTIHIQIVDLNQDNKPDFIALIAQEHEEVVAFLNQGGGQFTKVTIYKANEPAFGSSGIELVDMDGDGDLDILYCNGDALDVGLPKPYHGVAWLENKGTFPYTYHRIANQYGCHFAKAVDLDGDGDLDVVSTGFFPITKQQSQPLGLGPLQGILWHEQTSRGKFVRHHLDIGLTTEHASFDIADVDGDGDLDIAVGVFIMDETPEKPADYSVALFRNLTADKKK